MPQASLDRALTLVSTGLSISTVTYGFYQTPIPGFYTGISVGYPAVGGGSPLYTSVFDPLSPTEQNYIGTIFSGQLSDVLAASFAPASSGASAHIGIGGLNYVAPDPTGGLGEIGAYTNAANASATNSEAADVWFLTVSRQATGTAVDSGGGWGTTGDYFYFTAVHEIGHSLGLRDARSVLSGFDDLQKYTAMSYNFGSSQANPAYGFQLYDVAALQYLYGPDTNFHAGNDVYSNFTSAYPTGAGTYDSQLVIWDAGGQADAINGSAYNQRLLIDLRPGRFSSIGEHTGVSLSGGQVVATGNENVAVAFGAVIENAVGSAKDDAIFGSAFDNSLTGGDGNDTLFGDGDDAPGDLGGTTDYRRVVQGGTAQLDVHPDQQKDTLIGGKGDDSIVGSQGEDSLSGGEGADTLMGGQGNDLLSVGGGADSLSGQAGDDLIDLRSAKSTASDVVSVKLAAGGGKDYLLFSPDDSHTPTIRILLTDYTLSQVTFLSDQVVEDHPPSQDLVDSEGQLIVKLADGTSLFLGALHGSEVAHNGDTDEGSYQGDANIEFVFSGGVTYELNSLFGAGGPATLQVVQSLDAYKNAPANWPNINLPPTTPSSTSVSVVGSSASSVLYGGDAGDILTAGPADDQLLGGKGDDDYYWQRGNGDIAVQDNARDPDDFLQLTGVASSAATFNRVGDDVVVTIAPSTPDGVDGGEITLQDMFSGVEDVGIDRILFSDVARTADQIRQQLLTTPTPGPDTLIGGETADTLSGGAGDDWLDGGAGNDVFTWARGDGNDAIDDWGGDSGDRLELNGIAPQNVHLRPLNASDAVLIIDPSTPGGSDGARIELRSVLANSGDGVDKIGFTGGVVWEQADFADHLEIAPGTGGNDNIYGGPADDTLAGGVGADTISGGEGNDVVVWSRGDGNDVLSDEGWNEGDRLVLLGVLPGDVTFGAQDGNVILFIAPSGDGGSITLVDSTQDFSWTGIDEIVFDNAVVWGETQLQAGLLAASQTPGHDTIQGFMASETIVGGVGDDVIDGGLGDDVFQWSAGDGSDTLTEGQECGYDRLELLGVSPGSVTVEQDGDDILLVMGSATLRLVNQALWSYDYGVETFVLDGQTWTAADLMDQLAGV